VERNKSLPPGMRSIRSRKALLVFGQAPPPGARVCVWSLARGAARRDRTDGRTKRACAGAPKIRTCRPCAGRGQRRKARMPTCVSPDGAGLKMSAPMPPMHRDKHGHAAPLHATEEGGARGEREDQRRAGGCPGPGFACRIDDLMQSVVEAIAINAAVDAVPCREDLGRIGSRIRTEACKMLDADAISNEVYDQSLLR